MFVRVCVCVFEREREGVCKGVGVCVCMWIIWGYGFNRKDIKSKWFHVLLRIFFVRKTTKWLGVSYYFVVVIADAAAVIIQFVQFRS